MELGEGFSKVRRSCGNCRSRFERSSIARVAEELVRIENLARDDHMPAGAEAL